MNALVFTLDTSYILPDCGKRIDTEGFLRPVQLRVTFQVEGGANSLSNIWQEFKMVAVTWIGDTQFGPSVTYIDLKEPYLFATNLD